MNNVVLITGSSRGIGKAIAIEFAKKSYDIVINYLKSEEKAFDLAAQIEKQYRVKTLVVKADVRDEKQVKTMVDIAIKKFGKIDVLVNNAGIAIDKDFDEKTVEDWQETLSTNLIAPFIVSRCVGNEMKKNKKGKIINISSTNGINTFFPTSVDYDASKAALINLTHNLAIQYAPYINVNCVAPGWVNTEMNKELPEDLISGETEKIYKKRFAEPEEVAKVVTFLASSDADYINNEIIKIDGGY